MARCRLCTSVALYRHDWQLTGLMTRAVQQTSLKCARLSSEQICRTGTKRRPCWRQTPALHERRLQFESAFLSITGWMGLQSRSQAEVFMEEEGKGGATTRARAFVGSVAMYLQDHEFKMQLLSPRRACTFLGSPLRTRGRAPINTIPKPSFLRIWSIGLEAPRM